MNQNEPLGLWDFPGDQSSTAFTPVKDSVNILLTHMMQ